MSKLWRSEKISKLLLKEICYILNNDLKDSRFKKITLTYAKITNDLQHASIYFQINNKNELDEINKLLKKAGGVIRFYLSRRIHLKELPDFKFIYDDSLEKSQRIEDLLKEINSERNEN